MPRRRRANQYTQYAGEVDTGTTGGGGGGFKAQADLGGGIGQGILYGVGSGGINIQNINTAIASASSGGDSTVGGGGGGGGMHHHQHHRH